MNDPKIYEANLPPASPSHHLATPSDDLFLETRSRSASSVSIRSSQSYVTIVENNRHDPELEKKPLHRKQTIKIHRTFSFWDWCKGLFDREGIMQKIGNSIEVVSTNEPDATMFDHKESPFSKTVYISPRTNSTQYMTARCLFDTGCYKGNIVSRSLVERLGYREEDFEPLSTREAVYGQTVTGEPVVVEAVVRLSWHHNTSPQTYRHMRFLVSSTTQCDMIVGAHSIVKYKLFDELIYATEGGSYHVAEPNENWVELKDKFHTLKSRVEDYERFFRKATTEKQREEYREKLVEKRHLRDVAELRADAAKLEDENRRNKPKKPTPAQKAAAAKNANLIASKRKDADERDRKWAEEHPPPVATPAADGSTRGRSGPQLTVTSPAVSSVGDSHAKKSSSTKKGPLPSGGSQKKA